VRTRFGVLFAFKPKGAVAFRLLNSAHIIASALQAAEKLILAQATTLCNKGTALAGPMKPIK